MERDGLAFFASVKGDTTLSLKKVVRDDTGNSYPVK